MDDEKEGTGVSHKGFKMKPEKLGTSNRRMEGLEAVIEPFTKLGGDLDAADVGGAEEKAMGLA